MQPSWHLADAAAAAALLHSPHLLMLPWCRVQQHGEAAAEAAAGHRLGAGLWPEVRSGMTCLPLCRLHTFHCPAHLINHAVHFMCCNCLQKLACKAIKKEGEEEDKILVQHRGREENS